MATDGDLLEAEELATGDVLSCNWNVFENHFSFFFPLAGISTLQAIKDNPIDVQATSRLNRLYMELLQNNPEWGLNDPDFNINRFMARLIFCFFAEDTGIFEGKDLFTRTIDDQSRSDNAHEVISTLFKAMATPVAERKGKLASSWLNRFRYVNGGLFSKTVRVPKFTRSARNYLVHAGRLDWRTINPDIFGSMIQAVADDDERGRLGLHYTSIPNILKVLKPLFLDDLREKLTKSWDSPKKLLNLRKQLRFIRVLDPACGSGNFLVVAYKQLREIEHEIIEQRIRLLGEKTRRQENTRSEISINSFFGIEIKEFACEVARLSLLIAEFQCDVLYLGQQLAADTVLPLGDNEQISNSNALRINWTDVCPIDGHEKFHTYICGNPPYKGSQTQTKEQKVDLERAFSAYKISTRQLDYVSGWFIKAAEYAQKVNTNFAFVSTNSICQGRIVPILWPVLLSLNMKIEFAYTSFKWSNLAKKNAGVVVIVLGLTKTINNPRLYEAGVNDETTIRKVKSINPYLISAPTNIVKKCTKPPADRSVMEFGNMPLDGGNLLMDCEEFRSLTFDETIKGKLTRRIYGSEEFIQGSVRFCLWIENKNLELALSYPEVKKRVQAVYKFRQNSIAPSTNQYSRYSHQFTKMHCGNTHTLVIPGVSSEKRPYLPVGLISNCSVVSNLAFGMYDAPIWNLSIIASRLHLIWIAVVCGRLGTGFRYSNTIGWNTFPIPLLSNKNKSDLTDCANSILHAREQYFPATIADMYDPERIDIEFPLVRRAHLLNCETMEKIYSSTPFKNDTERLELLFELYAERVKNEKN